MKKFIVLAVAALSMNAFAGKSMVTLSGYENGTDTAGVQERSLDFSNSTGSEEGANISARNIALNYAYEVVSGVQVGAIYKKFTAEVGGDMTNGDLQSSTTMGLQAIYNFKGELADTNYIALKYETTKLEESEVDTDNAGGFGDDDDKSNVWTVEFGHRFSLGNLWGMNFNYSPSANIAFSKTEFGDSTKDDASSTTVSLNFVKFDVLF